MQTTFEMSFTGTQNEEQGIVALTQQTRDILVDLLMFRIVPTLFPIILE